MGQLDTPPVMSPTGEKKQDSSDQHKAPPGGPTTGGWRLEVGDLIHYNVINYNPTPLPHSGL